MSTAELPKKKPLLALIIASEGALPTEDLERALRAWHVKRLEGRPQAFGQVVLQLKLMTPGALRNMVDLQRKLAAAPGGRKPLGLLAVERGIVKATVLVDALGAQAAEGKKLGEVLLERGALRKPQLDALLFFQKQAA